MRNSLPERGAVLVVGIGSSHGDDQAGWLVATEVESRCGLSSQVCVRRATNPVDLMDWLGAFRTVHLCDACQQFENTGQVHQFRYQNGHLVESTGRLLPVEIARNLRNAGTHQYGIPDVLQLAAVTGRLPEELIVWTIEASEFSPFQPVTAEVQRAASQVADFILASCEAVNVC